MPVGPAFAYSAPCALRLSLSCRGSVRGRGGRGAGSERALALLVWFSTAKAERASTMLRYCTVPGASAALARQPVRGRGLCALLREAAHLDLGAVLPQGTNILTVQFAPGGLSCSPSEPSSVLRKQMGCAACPCAQTKILGIAPQATSAKC